MIGFIFGALFGGIVMLVAMCVVSVGKEQENDDSKGD